MKTRLRDCVEILMERQTILFVKDRHFRPRICRLSKQAGGTFTAFLITANFVQQLNKFAGLLNADIAGV